MQEQLMLFDEPKNELSALWDSIKDLKTSQSKVRKRLFAEISNLQEELVKVQVENEKMKFRAEDRAMIRWTA